MMMPSTPTAISSDENTGCVIARTSVSAHVCSTVRTSAPARSSAVSRSSRVFARVSATFRSTACPLVRVSSLPFCEMPSISMSASTMASAMSPRRFRTSAVERNSVRR